jgi:hypothetical protein
MTTFLLNHIFHDCEKLSLAEQLRLARMLLDRIRDASVGPPAQGKAPMMHSRPAPSGGKDPESAQVTCDAIAEAND